MQIARTSRGEIALSPMLKNAIYVTAVIDLVIGALFLFGPELKVTLWPTEIAPVLMRFIGSIVLGNGFGALLAARQGTWEGARVLFTVALIYGVAVFFGLLANLLLGNANSVFWIYILVDAIFLVPIAYIYWTHEKALKAAS
jgi:hypothetical protein